MKINLVNWSVMRLLRILLGIAAIVQAYFENEGSYVLLGIFLLGTAFLNVGYCGPNGCQTSRRKMSEELVVSQEKKVGKN